MATGTGTAVIDFGVFPGSNEASAVVAEAGVSAGSKVEAWLMADDSTADYTASDVRYLAALVGLTCGTPSAGVGFTVYARCLDRLEGTIPVRYVWAD